MKITSSKHKLKESEETWHLYRDVSKKKFEIEIAFNIIRHKIKNIIGYSFNGKMLKYGQKNKW